MRTALQRHQYGPVWAQRLAMLAALIGLTGCGTQGDFQEVSPSASRADMHDWLSLDAIAGKPTWPSDFPLTEDERALRDLAYPLIEWPYDRHKIYSVAGEYGVIGADHRTDFDVTAYTSHLFGDERRTASSRYEVLIDDIRNDTTRLPQFGIPQPTGEEAGMDPSEWEGRVSRNAPCPCGSGRKYKHCHGALTGAEEA